MFPYKIPCIKMKQIPSLFFRLRFNAMIDGIGNTKINILRATFNVA